MIAEDSEDTERVAPATEDRDDVYDYGRRQSSRLAKMFDVGGTETDLLPQQRLEEAGVGWFSAAVSVEEQRLVGALAGP